MEFMSNLGDAIMGGITWFAENFIGLFQASADTLMSLITGIVPLLLVLLTAMYAITTWIGEERVTRAVQWAGKYAVTRYTIMPILAVVMLTNPSATRSGGSCLSATSQPSTTQRCPSSIR